MWFWGHVIFSMFLGCVLAMTMEFPYFRLYQILILPYITHDNLLQKWHDQIMMDIKPKESSLPTTEIGLG